MKRIVFLILFFPILGVAQNADSVLQNKTEHLIRAMDSTERADSMKRAVLLREIETLKGSNANKQQLVSKLQAIEREDSLKKANLKATLQKLKSSSPGYPINPFGDTLFFVYTRIGSFSAKERAAAITEKIKKLYDDYEFSPDSLTINTTEVSTEIAYHEIMVMSINELEAQWHDKNQQQLAAEYHAIIQTAIRNEREANTFINIALRIGAIILILTGLVVVILLINRLFRKIRLRIYKWKDTILTGIRFKGYQFLDSARQLQVVLFLSNILRLLIIAITLYIALPLLFSVFPWTQGIANTLIGWITKPLISVLKGFVSYLPDLFSILVISVITYYIVKFLKFVAGEIQSGSLTLSGFHPDWAKPTFNIVKFMVYAFSFVLIWPHIPGSQSAVFQGVSVFIGILLSLGSSSAISNAVAGLVITYMRPFKVGDRIRLGDLTGDVIEKTLLVTRIRTIKNENITIPNSSILAGHVTNYTSSADDLGLILNTTVTIGYDVPWKQVHDLLISAALKTQYILNDEQHKPFVLQTSLDDFYVAYQINAYTVESHRMATIYSELHQRIQDSFNEGGVEIMSPHYRAARDGSMTTIPQNYLPKDYKQPSFNVTLDNPGKKDEPSR